MKKLNLIVGAVASLVLINSTAAQAAGEIFNFTAGFGVTKCTKLYDENDRPKIECKSEGGFGGPISLELGNCQVMDQGTSCWGQWSAKQTVDGHTFEGIIAVSKWTPKDGKARYTVATEAKQLDLPESDAIHILNLAKSELSDTSILLGHMEKSKDSTGNEVTLIPAAFAAPAGKQPAAILNSARALVQRQVLLK